MMKPLTLCSCHPNGKSCTRTSMRLHGTELAVTARGARLAPKIERVAHAARDGLHQPRPVRQRGHKVLAAAHDRAQRLAPRLALRMSAVTAGRMGTPPGKYQRKLKQWSKA